MVLKFCLPAIDHAEGTASRLAVSGSQGTRRRSLRRRAARRYIAIPGAPRERLSRPPRFLHIRGRGRGESRPAGRGQREAARWPRSPAVPPGPTSERPGRYGARPATIAGGVPGKQKERGPGGPHSAPIFEVPSTGQRRPALPRASPAVPSALGGLASGFGMGPGVPRPPWPLTGGRRSAHHEVVMCVRADPRALGAAQRGDGPWGSTSDPTGSIARHPSLARRHPRRYEMLG